jgi:alanyl-tRNA synthetase
MHRSEVKLSPTTSYYIRKLLRQSSNTVKNVAVAQSRVSMDALSNLDEVVQNLYPSLTESSTIIQRIESLVCFHQELHSQTVLYPDHGRELAKLEQQIFQLLGF